MSMGFSKALVFVAIISLASPLCGDETVSGTGFAIILVESGEKVITNEHVASYDWNRHWICLSQKGIERWQSFVRFNESFDPPIRQLSELTAKEFAVAIDGVEMYRGHFLSIVSSYAPSGVTIYDTLGVPNDKVIVRFTRRNEDVTGDPRSRSKIAEYFQEQGKLVYDH